MLLLLNSTPTSYAQEEPVDLPFSLEVAQSEPPSTTGNLVCLDYFNISSIDVDIKPSVNQTTPGATVTFGGSISNTSDHPIVSGVLRAKILRSDEDIVAAGLGGEVVDQVVVASDVTMPGQGSVAVDYEWYQIVLKEEIITLHTTLRLITVMDGKLMPTSRIQLKVIRLSLLKLTAIAR